VTADRGRLRFQAVQPRLALAAGVVFDQPSLVVGGVIGHAAVRARGEEAGPETHGVVLVSDRAHGTSGFDEVLMAYHSRPVRAPQRPDWGPEPDHLAWHGREVFKGEPRHHG
jgi:hypothetical protein